VSAFGRIQAVQDVSAVVLRNVRTYLERRRDRAAKIANKACKVAREHRDSCGQCAIGVACQAGFVLNREASEACGAFREARLSLETARRGLV
jgi:hypothetical protein